jgi:hypothetical protein
MRDWVAAGRVAAARVADRASLWVPGALAWLATAGWLAFALAVIEPPSASDLTFLGARIYSSGDWPWNAVLIGVAAVFVVAVAFVLVAAAEATLLWAAGGRPSAGAVLRLVAIAAVVCVPVVLALGALGLGLAVVVPREFTSPDAGADALVRTASRVVPQLAAVGLTWTLAAALHAAAARRLVSRNRGAVDALRASPRSLWRAGAAALVQALAVPVLRLAYLVFVLALLGVLWGPIRVRLAMGGIDAAGMLLLVGFVAIWLCLVLGGGALHAWGSMTWTRLLTARGDEPATHGDAHRP